MLALSEGKMKLFEDIYQESKDKIYYRIFRMDDDGTLYPPFYTEGKQTEFELGETYHGEFYACKDMDALYEFYEYTNEIGGFDEETGETFVIAEISSPDGKEQRSDTNLLADELGDSVNNDEIVCHTMTIRKIIEQFYIPTDEDYDEIYDDEDMDDDEKDEAWEELRAFKKTE
jgi:hypothetical protein